MMPEAPAPVDMASAPALDRDLASGTFSPGSLNVVDLQRHFEAAAAAENVTVLPAPVGSSNDLEATIGTGDLPALTMPEDPDAVDATLNLRVSPMLEEAPPALSPTTDVSAEPAMPEIAEAFDDAAEMAPLEAPELPSMETPDEAADPGGATLPLTRMTLADLYLQQGLKQEASAVLSQVVRDEPEHAAAHSRLAQVSAEVAAEAPGPVTEAAPEFKVAETLPPRAAPAPPAAVNARGHRTRSARSCRSDAFRKFKDHAYAMLSRGVAGIRKRTIIVNLPGSPKGAVENLEVVMPSLAHAVRLLQEDPSSETAH